MKKVQFFNEKASEKDINLFLEEFPQSEVFFVGDKTKIIYEQSQLIKPLLAYKGITKPIYFMIDDQDESDYDAYYRTKRTILVHSIEIFSGFAVLKTLSGANYYYTYNDTLSYHPNGELRIFEKGAEFMMCVASKYIDDDAYERYSSSLENNISGNCNHTGNKVFWFEHSDLAVMAEALGFKEFVSDTIYDELNEEIIENYSLKFGN